jgi:hypothetical protein
MLSPLRFSLAFLSGKASASAGLVTMAERMREQMSRLQERDTSAKKAYTYQDWRGMRQAQA